MELDSDAILWSAPEGERAGRPLLVLLHGYGSHERDLLGLRPRLPEELVLAALRAPLPAPPGFSWFPVGGERPLDRADDARAAADLVAEWIREHAAAASSTGVLGFSQGAMLSLLILRRHPGLLDYAVALSGGILPGDEPGDAELRAIRPPVFFGYGLWDDVVPSEMFARTADWLPGFTADTQFEYPGLTHAVSEQELADITAFLRDRLAP